MDLRKIKIKKNTTNHKKQIQDGYFLSTYLEVSEVGNLFEYAHRHNHNLSLWYKKGHHVELIHYWELERLSGYKQHRVAFYNRKQALEKINELLNPFHLCLDDMVEIWGTPELSTCNDYHSLQEFPQFCYHNICHLFSGLMIDTGLFHNENILAFAVDGASDQLIDKNANKKYAFTGCYSNRGTIQLLPISSPGPLWNMAREYFQLREGTLMALASAVKCNLKEYPLPSFSIQQVNHKELYEFVQELFTQVNVYDLVDRMDPMFSYEENRIGIIMKIIQNLSLRLMERNVDCFVEKGVDPQKTYLSVTGGYGLNCPTNSYLMRKYGFKGFIAPPCIDDSGQSLGMALYAFYKKMEYFDFKLSGAYYGEKDNRSFLNLYKDDLYNYVSSISPYNSKQAVQDILEAPIVWFNGRAELGPRALGNRSILANPQLNTVKIKLNNIKQRQWWRPIAPIILQEYINDWFEEAYPSSHMLHTFQICRDKAEYVPAVLHLDDSARTQTVSKEDNSDIYDLLLEFYKETEIPLLCNTSLNDKGEPIINRFEEVINFALRKGIRVVYINRKRIELKNHSLFSERGPHQRYFHINKDEDSQLLKEKINPYHVDDQMIRHCLQNNLLQEYDLTKYRDIKCLRAIKRSMSSHDEFYKRVFAIKFSDTERCAPEQN